MGRAKKCATRPPQQPSGLKRKGIGSNPQTSAYPRETLMHNACRRNATCSNRHSSDANARRIDMERIEKTIEVERPVRTVYNQWTQFEEFPRFMDGVKEVTQLDDTHVRWHAE